MLSLSMIVRNEEHCLADCLLSVKDFVDEIVILDTGSTDLTVAIAKDFGARVEHLAWPGDFAPARNSALQYVQGDWVLVLDADEQLIPDCKSELNLLMSDEDTLVVNLLRYEEGSSMSPYSSVSRLFRRHARISWTRPYHSTIDDNVRDLLRDESHWRIVDCSVPALIHVGYKPELIKKKSKCQRVRNAMESWLFDNPGDPYACAKLGALEVSEGAQIRGIELLKQGLLFCEENLSTPMYGERYELLFNLGIAFASKDPGVAINFYRKALELPIDTRAKLGALLNLASLLMKTGDLDQAILLTKRVTKRAPEVALAWYNLGLLQRYKGDFNEAINSYQHAIALNDLYVEAHQNLALVQLRMGKIALARQSLDKAINILSSQGRIEEKKALSKKIGGIIKLDSNMTG